MPNDSTTTTGRSGSVPLAELPDPLKPIPTRRNVSRPAAPPDEAPATVRRTADEVAIARKAQSAEPPAEPPVEQAPRPRPAITISTTVQHRGRTFTISASDIKLDAFCDLLDEAGYAAPAEPQQWQTLPDGTPICPRHDVPMRKRERQGDTWWSHNVGTKEQPMYCRGHRGKDSPGYDS